MTRINAIRTNAVRTTQEARSVTWGRNTSAITVSYTHLIGWLWSCGTGIWLLAVTGFG